LRRGIELGGLGPAALDRRKLLEQLRQSLAIGGEDRRGLLEGLLFGEAGHA
jgi:hypothetical protein